MRKKSGLTILEQAIVPVPEFENVFRKLDQQVELRGQSRSTLINYTHQITITNQRILNIAGDKVTFIAKDYRDNAVKKPVTLDGIEFLRRFTMHILPRQFVKIRRFGIYNHTTKRNLALKFMPEEKPSIDDIVKRKQPPETNLQRLERLTGELVQYGWTIIGQI